MGIFSFVTSDTQKSVLVRQHFPVYLVSDTGDHWYESNYEGYGVFGGKDIFELITEMNWPEQKTNKRSFFFKQWDAVSPIIQLTFNFHDMEIILGWKTPRIVEKVTSIHKSRNLRATNQCPNQGYYWKGNWKDQE